MSTPLDTPGVPRDVDGDAARGHMAWLAADAAAREQALDISRSWLVAAPAGSGKTELLVQRILALYAAVDAPERVVAVTFTVKAATEMRARVLEALETAREGAEGPHDEALSPHALRTRVLARAVLAQDARRGWRLLEHPSRLDIGTIDALAGRIATQLPVASAFGGAPSPANDAVPLYRRAAERALAAAADDGHWHTLVLHYDGDASRVVDLLVAMLSRRDQWMGPMLQLRNADVRAGLERTLAETIDRELAQGAAQWPPALVDALMAFARRAAEALSRDDARREDPLHGAAVALLAQLCERAGLPPGECRALAHWRTLGELLLTEAGAVRKDPPKVFPPIGSGAGADARRAMRDEARAFFDHLRTHPRSAAALARMRALPEPRYAERAREFLDALVHVLPRVAAELVLVFAEEGHCDFAEVTLRALHALGDAGDPSPVLMAQDLRVEHLLIDEVQDTSRRQWQLIERLTSGWQQHDGRTLFVVGDPMQSIYGFREADVHGFLDASQGRRFGGVALAPLALARNFRSQRQLVDHVNATFPDVLARLAASRTVASMFTPALAVREAHAQGPSFEWADGPDDEAARTLARIRAALDQGEGDVAILVRARPDLGTLLEALRDAGIAYDAVGLDSLAGRAVSRDLLWLARALSQPADRLAWMSALRAPFAGLRLADLLVIADAARSPGLALHDDALDAVLSADGAARRARVAAVVARVSSQRDLPLSARTRMAWLALGGAGAYGADPANVDAAEAMLALIDEHDRGGDLDDFDALLRRAEALKAEAPAQAGVRVKIMTAHAAKGLEFDTVVLPGLARAPRKGEPVLMRWRARHPDRALLVATPRARDEEDADPIDAFLAQLDADDAEAELARLAYVAMTRARGALHLIAQGRVAIDPKSGARSWRHPPRGSVLALLWPMLLRDDREPPDEAATSAGTTPPPRPQFERLAWPGAAPVGAGDVEAPRLPPRAQADGAVLLYDWAGEDARAIGIVAHRLLSTLTADDVAAPAPMAIEAQRARVDAELATLGVSEAARGMATERVLEALARTLEDPQGRWLFDPTHTEVEVEWALTMRAGARTAPGVADAATGSATAAETRRIVVDRTFIADGVRWIVDFKTSRHEGGDIEGFLAQERERHAAQLEGYARALAALDARPRRLALYFPALGRMVSWPDPDRIPL